MHDVYAYGVIAPSTLIELSGDFPASGGYAEIAEVYPSIGGEAAGGAYVLARLGVSTKLNGNLLSDDDSSAQLLELLSGAGVGCSAIRVQADVAPVTEVVLATGAVRTVLGTYGKLTADAAWSEPSREDIRTSRIVCLDPFFWEASRRAARWCAETGTPYVTVDTSPDSVIARSAEVLVRSEEFAARTFETSDPREIHAAYTRQCSGLVILTRGSRLLMHGSSGEQPQECRPFLVEARDTTGAGDSFRAGIIYGMLRGYDRERLVRTACAVAAIVSQQPPGVHEIGSWALFLWSAGADWVSSVGAEVTRGNDTAGPGKGTDDRLHVGGGERHRRRGAHHPGARSLWGSYRTSTRGAGRAQRHLRCPG